MVDSSASREQKYQALLTKAREAFANAENVPVHTTLEDGNVTVRQSADGWDVMNVAEVKVIDGLKPEDFKCFFDNWAAASVEINDTCKRVDKCDEEEGHDIYKMEINFPWPLWNRLMILALYKRYDQENGEQICFFSCAGNEAMKEKHFDEND